MKTVRLVDDIPTYGVIRARKQTFRYHIFQKTKFQTKLNLRLNKLNTDR